MGKLGIKEFGNNAQCLMPNACVGEAGRKNVVEMWKILKPTFVK